MVTPEQHAEIRRLYYGEHWKVGTIAAALGVHHDTVRAALVRHPRDVAWDVSHHPARSVFALPARHARALSPAGEGPRVCRIGRATATATVYRRLTTPAVRIGRGGCVRSKAWIDVFSSTLSTVACSGGCR